jgi:hypothetical protein
MKPITSSLYRVSWDGERFVYPFSPSFSRQPSPTRGEGKNFAEKTINSLSPWRERVGVRGKMAKVQELSQAIHRLIEDAALRESYGACAREIVKAYEAGAVLDKLEALYQGLKDRQ